MDGPGQYTQARALWQGYRGLQIILESVAADTPHHETISRLIYSNWIRGSEPPKSALPLRKR